MPALSARLAALVVVALALATGVIAGVAVDRRLLLPHHWAGRRRGDTLAPDGRVGGGPPADGVVARLLYAPPDGAPESRASRGGAPDAEWVTSRLADELALTAAQRVQVDSIVTRRMAERRALLGPVRARMTQIVDSTRAELDAVLTPDQRARLGQLRPPGGPRDSRGRDRGPDPGAPEPHGP
jgi:hypothetical protein